MRKTLGTDIVLKATEYDKGDLRLVRWLIPLYIPMYVVASSSSL